MSAAWGLINSIHAWVNWIICTENKHKIKLTFFSWLLKLVLLLHHECSWHLEWFHWLISLGQGPSNCGSRSLCTSGCVISQVLDGFCWFHDLVLFIAQVIIIRFVSSIPDDFHLLTMVNSKHFTVIKSIK